jgi:hypothetical protein
MTAGQWDILSTEHALPLPPVLSELDYGSVLRLRREVVIDVEGLRGDCGLPSDAPLLAAASWSSTGTMLRRALASAVISDDDDVCLIELSGEIAGGDIADTLHIDTQFCSLAARVRVVRSPPGMQELSSFRNDRPFGWIRRSRSFLLKLWISARAIGPIQMQDGIFPGTCFSWTGPFSDLSVYSSMQRIPEWFEPFRGTPPLQKLQPSGRRSTLM